MDINRLEKIEYGKEYMDVELLTFIEQFKSFDGNKKPVVTILCSDNRLLSQMIKLVDNYTDIDFHVCGTFNGIDEAINKIYFSDAIIVNTLALKISPDGLYKSLKAVEELGKDIYFILSGWESLPKNIELCNKKVAQIDIEFPFAKIKDVRNVFDKNMEGFLLIEDVMSEYSKRISESFEFIHKVQVEVLFRKTRKEVIRFREKICLDIQKEQSLLLQLSQSVNAKQKRYEITFSHATVGLTDTIERFERMVKNIDMDDILYSINNDYMSTKEKYLEKPREIENEAKKSVYSKFEYLMNSFDSSELSKASLNSKNYLNIEEAKNDLLNIVDLLKSSRFIYYEKIDELEKLIRETMVLVESAKKYDDSASIVLEQVKESLRGKIFGFQFEKNTQAEISTVVIDLINKSQALTDSTDTLLVNKEIIPSEKLNELKWICFCSELDRLIIYSKNSFSALAMEYSRTKSAEMDIQSKNSVKSYFSSINETLNSILEELNNRLSEFGREEL